MDIKRLLLTVCIAVVGVMLWTKWQDEHPNNPSFSTTQTQTVTNAGEQNGFVPSATPSSISTATNRAHSAISNANNNSVVDVKTDLLHFVINLKGGDIISAQLLQYPVSLKEKNTPTSILSNQSGQYYVLQNGVTSSTGQAAKATLFQSQNAKYRLKEGQNKLSFSLKSQQGDLQVIKTFELYRGDYQVHVTTKIVNTSKSKWSGSFYHQIARQKPNTSVSSMAYDAGAVSSHHTPYQKVKYADMDKSNLSMAVQGGWVAMQQHYFLSAWIPNAKDQHHYYSQVLDAPSLGGDVYYLGLTSDLVQLQPGQSAKNVSSFYVGPEKRARLAAIAPGLELTLDYGILSPISSLIFLVMQNLYHILGNWGWTIVVVTCLIKLLLYWPSALSYRSMARMKMLAPRLKSLQERHADDRQALSKATMELYKSEKVNPMGGCLPMIVQIPIFIALYWVLIESVELRQAPFILWIHDLSVKDPFYVLPILMGGSMFLQQKMSPAPADPSMAKMQLIMPIVFTVFFMHFPAGLVLYWLTNNLISVAQQSYVMRSYDPKKADQARRHKNKKKRQLA